MTPKRAKPTARVYLQVRLMGDLKNQITAHCKRLDCSVNGWVVEVLKSALRNQRGLPEPPRALAPLPTPAEEIRAWAEGEKVLTPCGKRGECFGTLNAPETHDGMSFCRECKIRVA